MFQPLHPTDYDEHIEIVFRDPVLWIKIAAYYNQYQLIRIQELINMHGVNFLTEEMIYAGIVYPRRVEIIHACLDALVLEGWISKGE